MRGIRRGVTLVTVMIALFGICAGATAQVATTTIQDTVYRADGTPAGGTVVVTWQTFTTAAGQAVAAGNTSATIGPNGALSLALTPNANATPAGTYYTAVLHLNDGTTSQQYWVVPVSSAPVTLAAIENQVLPTSVAMQTASRSYVDAKVAAVAAASGTGTTGSYVPTTGGTMTGPLVLPADPVTPNQAADKHYTEQLGFVGSGVSGAYVKAALTDVDYIRRVSLNVARIASIANGALTLEQPLLAGIPTTAMKVSSVTGFCDREGSTFFQEWSALFVAEGQQGERVLWHYPRLQSMASAAEGSAASGGGLELLRQVAQFRALPVTDSVDAESVVCFRSFVVC